MPEIEISCLCGECVVAIDGAPETQFYCHCDDCQATSGGAYIKVAVYSADAVRIVRDNLVAWTLRTMPRHRCKTCGTHMLATVEEGKLTGVKANLLPSEAFSPQYHQHCSYAVLPIVDDLPHYAGFAPEGGGSDDRVDW
jgi:hypothetical protein